MKNLDADIRVFAIVGILAALNAVGVGRWLRLDLTRDREFTLSRATRDTLAALDDPLTIRGYFSRDLPPPHGANARYVRDLLEEYAAWGRGNVRFELVDPAAAETGEDKEKKKEVRRDLFGREIRQKTSVEKELEAAGIPPVQVRVNEADKLEVKRAYMGIALRYRDKKEVIPVVTGTKGLEYDLTTLIRKMSRERTPELGLVTGFGEPAGLRRLRQILTPLYDVTPVDLARKPEIPAEVDGLLVIGPSQPVTEDAQRAIDAFVTGGKPAAFLLDVIHPDLERMEARPASHGLGPMLDGWGIHVGEGLVVDAECATIGVTQQRGAMRFTQPVRYPYVIAPRGLDPEHPVTRGLGEVTLPFMSPLSPAGISSVERVEKIVRSSARSGVTGAPFDLNPLQEWRDGKVGDPGEKTLIAAVRGELDSRYGNPKGGSGRVLVAGGSSFATDEFLSRGNEALLLNLVDWLLLDEALLEVRSRGLAAAPLAELADGARRGVRWGNVAGIPLAFIAFGLVRWRRREGRRDRVRAEVLAA